MLKIIFILGLLAPAFATTYSPVAEKYDVSKLPEYEAIMGQLKSYGDFSSKTPPPPADYPREMSRGERAVEEAKARNRAILAEKNKQEAAQGEKKDDLDSWKKEEKATREAWKKEVKDTLAQWKREQDIFLGRIKVYKENTFEIPVKKEKIIEKKVPVENLPDVHIVNAAFSVPVRDQKDRPTCSAFAGVRAVEVVLAQNKQDTDLSEHYFYWSSKPNCQNKPCSEKGSWVTPGFRYSQTHPDFDVPLESTCAYKPEPQDQNETHTPLSGDCRKGSVKVVSFDEVRTLSEVVEKLKQDIPVIMAAKLSENFYRNKGLIRLSESGLTGAKLDAHAKGHAFLAVGVMELPEKLIPEEGTFCIIIANSWGKGWGAGGYSCLTEKWLLKFRQPSPFVAVTRVSVR